MFAWLGKSVVRYWAVYLCGWILLAVMANSVTSGWINRLKIFAVAVPGWKDVVEDGEFAFLPKNMPSIRAEDLFHRAFPDDRLASSVVLVIQRAGELTDADRTFISDELTPQLLELQQQPGSIIEKVRDFNDKQIGNLLDSADRKATLVVIELKTEFLNQGNKSTIDAIERLVHPQKGELRSKMPDGMYLAMSGSATVGRDMLTAAEESASGTHTWTIILVVGLLLMIYRAPLVAVIPLASVFVALQISMAILILLTWAGNSGIEPFTYLKPFSGLRTYISVVAYGAGVDYCLFLVARYKEELDRGRNDADALAFTLERIGPGLTASAGTVACGIGAMILAWFGKFQQAGIAMSFALLIMLICSLTLTPAMLRVAGKFAFWPYLPHPATATVPAVTPAPSKRAFLSEWIPDGGIDGFWRVVSLALLRRPDLIWMAAVMVMVPFAFIGVVYHDDLSYGLLSELPPTTTSVVGAKAVQDHFAAGETGPLTVLLHNPNVDFTDAEPNEAIDTFIQNIVNKKEELGLNDIRSTVNPLGLHIEAGFLTRGVARKRYISRADGLSSHVARFDLILNEDPFSRGSMQQVRHVKQRLQQLLPESIRSGSELHFLGTTPSILDLKAVTDRDQIVIDAAVLLVVLAILIVLLRMVAISGYLVLSVFFSYFVSLGMTITIFRMIDPQYAGIDWKVPIFLFTILVAVGEDYNIFLMARVQEDQHSEGSIKGIRTAMLSTGSIISSCGIIMAGTFFSLVLAGHLRGAQQLGTALTLGVLLDTFIIRPILVPAWLIMVNTNRFGRTLSHWLGKTHLPIHGAATKTAA